MVKTVGMVVVTALAANTEGVFPASDHRNLSANQIGRQLR